MAKCNQLTPLPVKG